MQDSVQNSAVQDSQVLEFQAAEIAKAEDQPASLPYVRQTCFAIESCENLLEVALEHAIFASLWILLLTFWLL